MEHAYVALIDSFCPLLGGNYNYTNAKDAHRRCLEPKTVRVSNTEVIQSNTIVSADVMI